MKLGFAAIAIAVGFLFVAVYFTLGWRCRRYPSLYSCIAAILAGSGVVCGVTLALAPFVNAFKELVTDLDLYLAVGGFAVFYVSVHGYWKSRPRSVVSVRQQSGDATSTPVAEARKATETSERE